MNYDYIALGDAGYTGTVNDRVFKYLGDQGYNGSLNDRKFKYYGDLGYNGTLRDRIRQASVDAGYNSVHNYVYNVGEVYGANPIIPLFNNGETGFWYDPSDLTTLFQDSAGTTPVTGVEQPVGLMLDKSQGATLGAELVTNGTFDTDSDWTKQAGVTISGGTLNTDGTTSGELSRQSNIGITAGSTYRVSFSLNSISTGSIGVKLGGGVSATFNTAGDYVVYLNDGTLDNFQITSTSSAIASVDNISVKEVAGQHATQSTSASRPTLSARYNLLEQTESFSTSDWTHNNITLTTGQTDPLGGSTAQLLDDGTATNTHTAATVYTVTNGKTYTLSCYLKDGTLGNAAFGIFGSSQTTSFLVVDLTDGTQADSTGDVTNVSITDAGNGWYRCKFDWTATASTSCTFDIRTTESATWASRSYTGANNTVYIWGASLVESQYDSLGYQRVGDASTTASDYDSSNSFPKYLKFDGTDDYMVVNGLSASSGPITAHFGYVTDDGESTATQYLLDVQTGRTILAAVRGATVGEVGYFDGGWTNTDIDTEALSVTTFNLNSTAGQVKVNGTEVITGTGLYTELALGGNIILGADNSGSAGHVNGNLYSAILRSTTSTDAEIDRAEAYINRKMGGGLL